MIHGRFQPFHNGHMAYLRLAAARCDELWVGITSPDRDHLRPEAEDPARHLPESNPFGYADRLLMVEGAAAEAGVGRVRVIPFPVGEPRLWDDYLPRGAVHFLRLLSPWGDAKLARLRERGERVQELPAPEGKVVSGTAVRAALREGGDWRALVPAAVAAVIDDLVPDAAAPPRRP